MKTEINKIKSEEKEKIKKMDLQSLARKLHTHTYFREHPEGKKLSPGDILRSIKVLKTWNVPEKEISRAIHIIIADPEEYPEPLTALYARGSFHKGGLYSRPDTGYAKQKEKERSSAAPLFARLKEHWGNLYDNDPVYREHADNHRRENPDRYVRIEDGEAIYV